MKLLSLRLGCVIVALLVGRSALAERNIEVAPKTDEQRVALVIGNGAYKHTSPLANPPADARLVADTLASLGFRLVGGRALVDAEKPAMEKAIREFGQRLRGGAIGLFYYAGHGVQVKGENYLVPVSANVADEADVKYEFVSAGYVLDEMSNAGNRLNIVILDACRNNPFGGRGLRSAASGLAQITAPAGTVISYATQPGNTAADGSGQHSPYTLALAAAMKRPGQGLFETFNEVGLTVKNTTGGRQQPWLATSPIEGGFQFARGGTAVASVAPLNAVAPVPAAEAAANDRAFWDSVKDTKNADELQAYLDQYPYGLFAALARTRLNSLRAPIKPTQELRIGVYGMSSSTNIWSGKPLALPEYAQRFVEEGGFASARVLDRPGCEASTCDLYVALSCSIDLGSRPARVKVVAARTGKLLYVRDVGEGGWGNHCLADSANLGRLVKEAFSPGTKLYEAATNDSVQASIPERQEPSEERQGAPGKF